MFHCRYVNKNLTKDSQFGSTRIKRTKMLDHLFFLDGLSRDGL